MLLTLMFGSIYIIYMYYIHIYKYQIGYIWACSKSNANLGLICTGLLKPNELSVVNIF